MIALLGAMKGEIGTLRRKMALEETVELPGCVAYRGKFKEKEIILVRTGVGKRRAEKAAQAVMERYPLKAVISMGFAGSLDAGVMVSDLVIYSKVSYSEDGVRVGKSIDCDPALVGKAQKVAAGSPAKVVPVDGVTVPRMVTEPDRKRTLGTACSAQAVDMESYWIARVASQKKTPFLTVRAISDGAGDRLPPFERFVGRNGWNIRKAVQYFGTHPWQIARLLRLRRNANRAEKNLVPFLEAFVESI